MTTLKNSSYEESLPEKAVHAAYKIWSKSVKPVKRTQPYDYMRELLGRMTGRDFTDLQKWEDRKIKEWKSQGRLEPNGRLLVYAKKGILNSGGSI